MYIKKKLSSFLNNTVVSYSLALSVFVIFAIFVVQRQIRPFNMSAIFQNPANAPAIRTGFINTVWISVRALVGSVILGFILYLVTLSKVRFFKALVDLLTEIIYGTPLLVMIMIMGFVIGPAFGSFNRQLFGLLGIVIYITPYMTNIFKSAFASIGAEQYMAMDLFGFNGFQRYRYIIIPQVIRILMPPMMNNFSLIIKGSALLNVVVYRELFFELNRISNDNFRFLEGFFLMWGLYLLLTIPLSQMTKYIDRRWGL